jgi:hypothetical protein
LCLALPQNEGNPALNDVVYSIGGLLPPAIRERIAAFSFTCLPMQLHAVSGPRWLECFIGQPGSRHV